MKGGRWFRLINKEERQTSVMQAEAGAEISGLGSRVT
jgi:hypothetical protein